MISPALIGALLRVGGGDPASFDRGLANAVLEAEGGASGRELIAVLAPDHFDAGELLVRVPCPLGERLQPFGIGRERGQRDVHVGRPERLLPVLGTALAHVAELGCARRHPLPELWREAVQRILRYAQRLETLVGEGDRDPRVLRRIGETAGRSRRTGADAAPVPVPPLGRRCGAADTCPHRARVARAARRSGCHRARGWGSRQ